MQGEVIFWSCIFLIQPCDETNKKPSQTALQTFCASPFCGNLKEIEYAKAPEVGFGGLQKPRAYISTFERVEQCFSYLDFVAFC